MGLDVIELEVRKRLSGLYDVAEAENIADWVMESLTGKNRLERNKDIYLQWNETQRSKLEHYLAGLMEYKPVQYVLGESYFYGMKLFVDERVLIPRPETEELADWVIKYCREKRITQPAVLDMGTGSGCLALAMKKEIPAASVSAVDISDDALAVARGNAKTLGLAIDFFRMDILVPDTGNILTNLDIIVSNPPYITLPEQESILPNVLHYEPHQALFVTDNDPLQFYKAIESFAREHLERGGAVFLELHRDFALATEQYYVQRGWKTILRKDMQGNDRMLQCTFKSSQF